MLLKNQLQILKYIPLIQEFYIYEHVPLIIPRWAFVFAPFSVSCFAGLRQGEEAEGDAGHGAAAGQEHEQPALVALWSGGRAVQAHHLQRLSPPGDPEEAGGAAGEREARVSCGASRFPSAFSDLCPSRSCRGTSSSTRRAWSRCSACARCCCATRTRPAAPSWGATRCRRPAAAWTSAGGPSVRWRWTGGSGGGD